MKTGLFRIVCFFVVLFVSASVAGQAGKTIAADSLRQDQLKKDSIRLKDSAQKKDSVAGKPADSTAPAKSHLQANITWQSNDVNNGRQDSTKIPLVTPEISYIFKSGFEIDLQVGYNVNDPSPQVNQYTLDGSYTFNPGNYSGTVTLSGFIYSEQSPSTTSEQKGSLEYANSYTLPFIQPGVNFTWTFGNHIPDYQISPSLQQAFNIGNLSITPTATMNAATQNAYNAYYQNRRFTVPGTGHTPPLPDSVTITGEVLNASKFQILDYEFSCPFNYTAGQWTFDFTPTYALPVNPADIRATITTNHVAKSFTYKEKLPNLFYWSVELTYAF